VTKVNPRNKNGFTLKWMRDAFGTKSHFEVRRGTHEQAVAYANKVDSRISGPWTVGEFTSLDDHRAAAGQRIKKSTLTDVKDAIDAGATDAELWSAHTSSMLRYANAFDKYRLVVSEARDRDQPMVVVLWGPPGTGKSHKAREICKNNGGGHWFTSGNGDNAWWDGYDPVRHPVVVLDDFKGGIRYTTLLRMLDKYPLQVETKGSTRRFTPKIVVITSNTPPNQWYFQNQQDANHDSSALLRRLEGAYGAVIEMKEKYVEPDCDEPDLKDVIDLLIDGTLLHREDAVRSEYLSDVGARESRAAVAAALIDLTTDEELSESEADVGDELAWRHGRVNTVTLDEARAMKFENQEDFDRDFADDYRGTTTSRIAGDDDDGVDEDEDVDDKRQHPTPPPQEEPVPWIDEVERDDYEAANIRNRLRRAAAMTKQSTPLTFAKPLGIAGRFKKLGPQPVQAVLGRATSATSRKRRLEDDTVLVSDDV